MSTHGEKCDRALRRLREALDPIAQAILEAAATPGAVAMVTAGPRIWGRIHAALADAEVWPIELLGPVEVTAVDETGKPQRVPAWFTRGQHEFHRFAMVARSRTRNLEGGRLELRECPIGTEMHWAWWAPPDPAKGRATWGPVAAFDPDAVPVTVWVNPLRRGAQGVEA